MTHLRQIMLEELRRRNFAETTIRSYLHGVEYFSRYFHRPPDTLGPEDIRKYQAMLFTQLKFSPNTVILRLASLRFFYIHVLKRGWSIAETPYPKKVRHLPQVLSQEEVARLIDAAESPFHRILLMTLFVEGSGEVQSLDFASGLKRSLASVTTLHGFLYNLLWMTDGGGLFAIMSTLARPNGQIVFCLASENRYPVHVVYPGRQGRLGPRRYVQPKASPGAAHLLARAQTQTDRVAVCRQPMAHRKLS